MKRFSQTLKVMLALFVAVFSNGVLPTTAAYAAEAQNSPGNNGTLKVHEIGTPSGTESNDPKVCSFNFEGFGFDNGQTGYIILDKQQSSTTYGPYNVGPASNTGYFVSQDFNVQSGVTIPNGSYMAIMYGKDTPYGSPTEKAKSKVFKVECASVVQVPATPAVNDPCGVGNATWIKPSDTAQIDWTLKANGDLVAETEHGYIFSDQTTIHNYGKAVDSNVACIVTIPVPATPSVNDPCGLNNAAWIVPVDTAQIDWVLQANGDLVANTKAGYEFATGNKTSHNYGKAVDSGKLCIISIPAKPAVNDPCGPRNAMWVIPEDTDSVHWSVVNGHLIATAQADYLFSNYQKTHDYGTAVDSNVACIISIPVPKTPEVKDPCGLHNAQWIVPKDTMQVDWSINQKGELVATAKTGYIFENDEHSHNYGKPVDSGKLCPVKPEAPKFIDYCGERTDYVVIPWVKGAVYKIDGKVAYAGYHKVSGSVTVTVYADGKDYVLVGEEQGPWTHEFVDTECVTISKTSQPVTDTNGDGGIGVGDTVTWNITVTNNSDNDLDNFRIELTDSTATIVDNDYVKDGVIQYLKHGTSVSVTATSVLNVDDVKACKATNLVTFQGWYTRNHHHEIDKYGHEDTNMSFKYNDSMDNDNEDEYDLSGSAAAQAVFTCPTPGHGNGGGTTTTSELPAELPSTGPSDTNPLVILAGSAIAYAITYVIQRRRELMASN
jgi:hypothetical protein